MPRLFLSNLSNSVRMLGDITRRKEKSFFDLDRWTAKLLIFTRNLKLYFRMKIYIVSVHVSI